VTTEYVLASDGILARKQGRYAEQKLGFIDRYLPAALSATRRKADRVFLDMFAGPGLNCDDEGYEFDGSPLRAMRATTAQGERQTLTRYIGCNIVPEEHEALQARVTRLRASGQCAVEDVSLFLGDANLLLPRILSSVPEHAWICAFLDIEGPSQLPWSSLSELRRRHGSVDLYLLFPLEMGWNRLAAEWREHPDLFTRAFGCEEWRPAMEGWETSGLGYRARRMLLELYLRRLRALWRHVEMVKAVRLTGDRLLYRMIFATNHPAGVSISAWAQKRGDDQLSLDLLR
jgi:three-Cys-motif partner protein